MGPDSEPGRVLLAVEVIDNFKPHPRAVVDGGRIGQKEETQLLIVAQPTQDLYVPGSIDLDLDRILIGPEVANVLGKAVEDEPDQGSRLGRGGQRTSPSQACRCGPLST